MNASAWVRGQLRTSVRYLAGVAGLGLFLGLAPAAMAVVEGTACTSDPQNITYGSLIICSIDPVGDTDTYRFSGTAGETGTLATRQGGETRSSASTGLRNPGVMHVPTLLRPPDSTLHSTRQARTRFVCTNSAMMPRCSMPSHWNA